MERRNFIRLLGFASPLLVFDPERFMWIPGANKIFLPSPARSWQVVDSSGKWAITVGKDIATFDDRELAERSACRWNEKVYDLNEQYHPWRASMLDTIIVEPSWAEPNIVTR